MTAKWWRRAWVMWGASLVMFNLVGSVRDESVDELKTEVMVFPTVTLVQTPTQEPLRSVLLEAPFGAQAPFGEWSDKRQQDGCEEASALIAMCAISNIECPISKGRIDKSWMKEKIIDIYDYQVEKWGSGIDTSAEDTMKRIINGYFGYQKVRVQLLASSDEIVRELMKGNIVIVPADGRLLFNPNFTARGPERHMLVIRGNDLAKKEFVAQDPGTRQGENYRYDENILFGAIRDYPTGDHEPIGGVEKRMIVVEK